MYYTQIAWFNIFNERFLVELYYILLKHHKNYNIIYNVIQHLILYRVWSLFKKNSWFVAYITNNI